MYYRLQDQGGNGYRHGIVFKYHARFLHHMPRHIIPFIFVLCLGASCKTHRGCNAVINDIVVAVETDGSIFAAKIHSGREGRVCLNTFRRKGEGGVVPVPGNRGNVFDVRCYRGVIQVSELLAGIRGWVCIGCRVLDIRD